MLSPELAYRWRLFTTLTWTNFKMRYYGSILGYIWSLFKPLALFGVLYVVFTVVMKQNAPHYKLFLLMGVIVWDFFVQGTNTGMNGFIRHYQMIRKINLPRMTLVLSETSGAFVGFIFNFCVFLAFALFDGVEWKASMIWFVPMIISLYLFVAGLGLILSIVVVKIRDMLTLWEVLLQLGFWCTPVMYPMSNVPEQYRFYQFLNPMSGILEYSRHFLLGIGEVTRVGYIYVLLASLLVFLLGVAVFKWKEAEMVEDL